MLLLDTISQHLLQLSINTQPHRRFAECSIDLEYAGIAGRGHAGLFSFAKIGCLKPIIFANQNITG
jgi:hypothetical protein